VVERSSKVLAFIPDEEWKAGMELKLHGARRFDDSGNLLKRLRISCSQHNSGEVASQSDGAGTSDALASASHNCYRILHDVPAM
jgi:hypothetical protein